MIIEIIKGKPLTNKLQCDSCNNIWIERRSNTLKKLKTRNINLCPNCLKLELSKICSERMRDTQSKTPITLRLLRASNAGKLAKNNPNCKLGWFTTERWNSLTSEEQKLQVTRANRAAHDRLAKMNEVDIATHYNKIMKGGLGFISKGQREVYNQIKHLGFIENYQISNMAVDMYHPECHIVIEYNGDAYHCNPRTYDANFYSTLIKMTAKQKWQKDIARISKLTNMGNTVIVIWESEWKRNPQKYINRIRETYEIAKNRENRK